MCGFWVVGVLLAAGVGRTDVATIRLGMPLDAVSKALGRPSCGVSYGMWGNGRVVFYDHTDWLGGCEGWVVHVGRDDCVTAFKMEYHPFVFQPPWLDALRAAIAPAGK